jgi:hypothetical protein
MCRRSLYLAFVIAAVGACDRPKSLVICHNSNCAEPADPENDDTIAAMRESFALEYKGRPVFDGMEIDTFWRAEDSLCLFAHDLDRPVSTLASEAATELAAYFARPGPIGYGDGPFIVYLELKTHVSRSKDDRHTPEQRLDHARCTWDVYTTLAAGAAANNRTIELVFESFEPLLLQALIDTTPPSTPVPYAFAAVQGIPAPLDSQTHPLSDYRDIPLGVVDFHAHWLLDSQYEAVRALDADLALWMFSATSETFDAIEQFEPKFIVTSEARLMRRWLEW